MRIPTLLLSFVLALSIGGCDPKKADTADKTIRFIMSDVPPSSELVPILKQELAQQGFTLDWVVVNDIIQPNQMVDSGAADANSFQHEPYFDQFVTDHQLKNI